jgi:hypothetical protein
MTVIKKYSLENFANNIRKNTNSLLWIQGVCSDPLWDTNSFLSNELQGLMKKIKASGAWSYSPQSGADDGHALKYAYTIRE